MIAQYFPPDFGGAARRAYNAAKGLSLQGSNVTVITAFPHYPHGHIPDTYKMKILTTEEIDGIKVIRTWIPSIEHSSNIKRVLLHISFIFSSMLGFFYVTKADIIFAMNPSFFCFFPALLYKLLLQKNIVRNVDDLWPETWYDLGIIKNRFVKKILDYVTKISYRVPSAIIPISHSYAKVIMTKYSIPKEKIEVIEHGVDVTKFYNLAAKQPIREHKNKVIMYSGALTIGYDFEVVIKSAKLLESEPVHFIIRGTGIIQK